MVTGVKVKIWILRLVWKDDKRNSKKQDFFRYFSNQDYMLKALNSGRMDSLLDRFDYRIYEVNLLARTVCPMSYSVESRKLLYEDVTKPRRKFFRSPIPTELACEVKELIDRNEEKPPDLDNIMA